VLQGKPVDPVDPDGVDVGGKAGRQGCDGSDRRDLRGQLRRAAADQRAGRGVGGGSSLGGCVSVDVGGAEIDAAAKLIGSIIIHGGNGAGRAGAMPPTPAPN